MSDATIRGRFVWHELMTTDTKSASAFFSRIVGWKTRAWDQDPSYTMFVVKGRPTAGLMLLPESARQMGAPPSWVTYIGTPDVDETARQAVALGGKIMKQPADIPTIGRFAIIQDPQGAVFAAFTPVQAAPSTAPPTVDDFSWHELATTDWRAALTFYQRLFGWEETNSMDMGPEMGTYQMYGWKGKAIGGMFNQSKQMSGPPFWLPYIKVADSKKVAGTVKTLAGKVLHGPTEVPGGDWIVQGMDLQGAVFAVHSSKRAARSEPVKAKTPKRRTVKKPPRKAKPSRKHAASKRPQGKKKGASKKRRR